MSGLTIEPVRPNGRAQTLDLIEQLLAQTSPLSVKEIVDIAGARLGTNSATPRNSVSRDLALDIKKNGDKSRFIRVGRGRFALRSQVES